MPSQFNPPTFNQLRWLVARDLDGAYTTEVLTIYELLRGHSANHGLPCGVPQGLSRGEYEESLRAQLGDQHLLNAVRKELLGDDPTEIAKLLPEAIAENATNAQKLFDEVRNDKRMSELVDEFLNGVLDCYSLLSKATPARKD